MREWIYILSRKILVRFYKNEQYDEYKSESIGYGYINVS